MRHQLHRANFAHCAASASLGWFANQCWCPTIPPSQIQQNDLPASSTSDAFGSFSHCASLPTGANLSAHRVAPAIADLKQKVP
mmetsp:Transcript_35578/g.68622  ORF Transcript_35578/g.68622 Transcript_35578/m.68622 type:complete len:83 (+) Transcript_35578:1485-1733(+)